LPKGVIYALINSDTLEMRYVGKTSKTAEARLQTHLRNVRLRRGCNHHLQAWLRSLLVPPAVVILERDVLDLNEAERRWIADLRAQGARLTNMTDGGDGCALTGRHNSAETVAKIVAKTRGRIVSAEARAHISASRQNGRRRFGMDAPFYGRRHSSVTKAKIAAALKGPLNPNWKGGR